MNKRTKKVMSLALLLAMFGNVQQMAQATDQNKVQIGSYTVEGDGKIYYGGNERNALIGDYLSSDQTVTVTHDTQWELPAGGGTVRYRTWHEAYEDSEHVVHPAGWGEWMDSIYNHAFEFSFSYFYRTFCLIRASPRSPLLSNEISSTSIGQGTK